MLFVLDAPRYRSTLRRPVTTRRGPVKAKLETRSA